jgi:hypothetical protein
MVPPVISTNRYSSSHEVDERTKLQQRIAKVEGQEKYLAKLDTEAADLDKKGPWFAISAEKARKDAQRQREKMGWDINRRKIKRLQSSHPEIELPDSIKSPGRILTKTPTYVTVSRICLSNMGFIVNAPPLSWIFKICQVALKTPLYIGHFFITAKIEARPMNNQQASTLIHCLAANPWTKFQQLEQECRTSTLEKYLVKVFSWCFTKTEPMDIQFNIYFICQLILKRPELLNDAAVVKNLIFILNTLEGCADTHPLSQYTEEYRSILALESHVLPHGLSHQKMDSVIKEAFTSRLNPLNVFYYLCRSYRFGNLILTKACYDYIRQHDIDPYKHWAEKKSWATLEHMQDFLGAALLTQDSSLISSGLEFIKDRPVLRTALLAQDSSLISSGLEFVKDRPDLVNFYNELLYPSHLSNKPEFNSLSPTTPHSVTEEPKEASVDEERTELRQHLAEVESKRERIAQLDKEAAELEEKGPLAKRNAIILRRAAKCEKEKLSLDAMRIEILQAKYPDITLTKFTKDQEDVLTKLSSYVRIGGVFLLAMGCLVSVTFSKANFKRGRVSLIKTP